MAKIKVLGTQVEVELRGMTANTESIKIDLPYDDAEIIQFASAFDNLGKGHSTYTLFDKNGVEQFPNPEFDKSSRGSLLVAANLKPVVNGSTEGYVGSRIEITPDNYSTAQLVLTMSGKIVGLNCFASGNISNPNIVYASNLGGGSLVSNSFNTLEWIGQQFTADFTGQLDQCDFDLKQLAGNITGTVVAKLYSDNGSNQPNVVLATSDPFDVTTIGTSFGIRTFNWSIPGNVTQGTLFHVILDTTNLVYNGDRLSFQGTLNSAYAFGSRIESTTGGASWSSTSATNDMNFETRGSISAISKAYDSLLVGNGHVVITIPFEVLE